MGVDLQTYRQRVGTHTGLGLLKRPRNKRRGLYDTIQRGILNALVPTLTLIMLMWIVQPGQPAGKYQYSTIINNSSLPATTITVPINMTTISHYRLPAYPTQLPMWPSADAVLPSMHLSYMLGNAGAHTYYGNRQSENDEGYEIPSLAKDMPNGIKIAQWNMRSIAPTDDNHWKLDQLRLILNSERECDILGITESWLNDSYKEKHVKIDGYVCNEREDRQGMRGGGILMYIKKHITYIRRKDLENQSEIETIWIELKQKNANGILICTAYRPPDYNLNTWNYLFEAQVDKAYLEDKEMILMGDFNVDLLDPDNDEKSG